MDNMHKAVAEFRLKLLIDKNKRIQELEKALKEMCEYYCTWYDKGIPKVTGADIAYDMYCMAAKALKEEEDGQVVTESSSD